MNLKQTLLIIGGLVVTTAVVLGILVVVRNQSLGNQPALGGVTVVTPVTVPRTSASSSPQALSARAKVSPADQALRDKSNALEKTLPQDISTTWDAQMKAQQDNLVNSKKSVPLAATSTK